MRFTEFTGLAAPYGRIGTTRHTDLGAIEILFERGAFASVIGQRVPLLGAHAAPTIGTCRLLEHTAAGLIVRVSLLPAMWDHATLAQDLLFGRMRLSLGFDDDDVTYRWAPPPTRRKIVTAVHRVGEISIVEAPGFVSTWLWPNDVAAQRRITTEDLDARARELDELRVQGQWL